MQERGNPDEGAGGKPAYTLLCGIVVFFGPPPVHGTKNGIF